MTGDNTSSLTESTQGLEHSLVELATLTGRVAAGQGKHLATAESCTGGAIARALTETAGSSDWFDRAFVTYSNQAKAEMLGVPLSLINEHGAVSEPVARAMAHGAIKRSIADLTMAVTGVAGPGGGSVDKPVGTVWFGWARREGNGAITLTSQRVRFEGGRQAVRLLTALHALSVAHVALTGVQPAETGIEQRAGPDWPVLPV